MKTRHTIIAAAIATAISTSASALEPQNGQYQPIGQPGTGYTIDYQAGVLAVAGYVYDAAGNPVWHLAAGPVNDNFEFSEPFLAYTGGQCLGCPYTPADPAGSAGNLELRFTAVDRARMTINGQSVDIQRLGFGFPAGTRGMMQSDWVLNYEIGSLTAAIRYRFNIFLESENEGSSGIGVDSFQEAGVECYTTGQFAGQCIIGDRNSMGDLERVFSFRRDVDEVMGVYVSPTTERSYAMTGYADADPSTGTSRSINAPSDAIMAAAATLLEAM